jgi:hypothetical protein
MVGHYGQTFEEIDGVSLKMDEGRNINIGFGSTRIPISINFSYHDAVIKVGPPGKLLGADPAKTYDNLKFYGGSIDARLNIRISHLLQIYASYLLFSRSYMEDNENIVVYCIDGILPAYSLGLEIFLSSWLSLSGIYYADYPLQFKALQETGVNNIKNHVTSYYLGITLHI